MLLFANYQVITVDAEDNKQKAAYKLNQIITEYGFKISVHKIKSMAFKRKRYSKNKNYNR